MSPELQTCFTKLVFGRSPGSSLATTSEKNVDACLAKCQVLDECLAITFRLEDGLCNALNRTYNGKYEASDERVVANKLCKGQVAPPTAAAELKDTPEAEEKAVQELPKMSSEHQSCFTKLVFGRSPGSSLGQSSEENVDA